MGRAGPRLSRLARVRHHPRRAAATGRPAPRTARPANQTPPTGFATPYPNRHNTNRFRRDRITSPTSGTYIRPHLHRYWDATHLGARTIGHWGTAVAVLCRRLHRTCAVLGKRVGEPRRSGSRVNRTATASSRESRAGPTWPANCTQGESARSSKPL